MVIRQTVIDHYIVAGFVCEILELVGIDQTVYQARASKNEGLTYEYAKYPEIEYEDSGTARIALLFFLEANT
jgi:hypothetical protein